MTFANEPPARSYQSFNDRLIDLLSEDARAGLLLAKGTAGLIEVYANRRFRPCRMLSTAADPAVRKSSPRLTPPNFAAAAQRV